MCYGSFADSRKVARLVGRVSRGIDWGCNNWGMCAGTSSVAVTCLPKKVWARESPASLISRGVVRHSATCIPAMEKFRYYVQGSWVVMSWHTTQHQSDLGQTNAGLSPAHATPILHMQLRMTMYAKTVVSRLPRSHLLSCHVDRSSNLIRSPL